MTVPTLLSKYQKHTYVVGLKKMYSQLKHITQLAPHDFGCPQKDLDCVIEMAGGTDNIYTIAPLMKHYLKVSKDCTGENKTQPQCNSPFIKIWGGGFSSEYLLLDDGSAISDGFHELVIDVNGEKGPNKIGRDQFVFHFVYNDGYYTDITPWGMSWGDDPARCTTQAVETRPNNPLYGSIFCALRVLKEDSMNY